jgi:hypothetical protein
LRKGKQKANNIEKLCMKNIETNQNKLLENCMISVYKEGIMLRPMTIIMYLRHVIQSEKRSDFKENFRQTRAIFSAVDSDAELFGLV